ncbi:uncharacterized protein C8Q71DRAFT_713662 [Rhodofomes roseus]|uniref:tRNA(Ile)-lysidine synthetase n=1 Tax=Rhodofomes roseus TaxID=34475 RepID=A0ABQ8K6V6_9APHY|nr:uncharacterized protein C8Q71DRAFT_713662 [Rhodofomes roseus]KAH9832976.1 hypothetical protein C8Q71DRAFT_713662 [Rhodofomes roseus]
MPALAAISRGEFLQLFQRCMPPGGWPHTIAVANSGGPDSTCLLYHLASLLKGGPSGLPQRVVSFHINHQLQTASDDMADVAAGTARALGVEHFFFTIPWSKNSYPSYPDAARTELTARGARVRAFFDMMTGEGATALVLGHHADDQVETMIMRSARGSRLQGLGGMLPVRRWGMGDVSREDRLGVFGLPGMSRWMVRPLLTVPKDRILATCDRNALRYAIDKTNFQPSLTMRNAIRHALDSPSKLTDIRSLQPSILSETATQLSVHLSGDFMRLETRDELRECARLLRQRVEMHDTQGQCDHMDNILARCLMPTLPSTLVLPSQWLQGVPTETLDILVSRVLRYASRHPWGSIVAQASGSRASYQAIADNVTWDVSDTRRRSAFTRGGAVLFVPGFVDGDGTFRQGDNQPQDARPAWRLQAAPPMESNSLIITSLLSQWRPGQENPAVLYDNRFLLRFNMGHIPRYILHSLSQDAVVQITHDGPEYSPQVVLLTPKFKIVVANYRRDVLGLDHKTSKKSKNPVPMPEQKWVHMELVRTLEAY